MILRIEDTDGSRTVAGATENIISTLRWAGIDYDHGPDKYRQIGPLMQSQRLALYRKYANHLLQKGKAYYCKCLNNCICDKTCGSIRFKRSGKEYSFKDAVYGEISGSADMQKYDPVIIKSDGFPTYHFANVVDDHLMDVVTVMRGMEWIPSTSLHLELYDAMQWQPPMFAHLPLLVRNDGSKLSKRQQDAFVDFYRRELDVLPQALINFVAFLGWTPREMESEVMDMRKMIDKFRLEDVNKSEACVDNVKLLWFNRKHLSSAYKELAERTGFDVEYCKQVLESMQDRVDTLKELIAKAPYFFNQETFDMLLEKFRNVSDLKEALKSAADKKSLRMALTSSPVGPPLSEVIRVLLLKKNQRN